MPAIYSKLQAYKDITLENVTIFDMNQSNSFEGDINRAGNVW